MFSKNLKYLRRTHDIEQEELAYRLGRKSGSSISEWEKGTYTPKIAVLAQIAAIFNVDLDDLMNSDLSLISNSKSSEPKILFIYNSLQEDRRENVLIYAEEQLNEQNHTVKEDNLIYIQRGHASAAGSAIYGDDSEVSMDVMPSSMVPKGADELVLITGDSMEPLIKKGSEVYIRHQPVVENGEIAIVRIEEENITCKRFYLDEEHIILKSINTEYKDMTLPKEQVQVIGKVLI